MKRIIFRIIFLTSAIAVIGFLLPQNLIMPVEGAKKSDYNKMTFWAYPWGTSVTHKGVDIFARMGTNVRASTYGLVLYTAGSEKGGNLIIILGPKWRLHLYSHLQEINTKPFRFVGRGQKIGAVGDTGNAKGKPPHLHFGITTLIPYPWRIDGDRQGWKKAFYLNPIDYLQ
jgi:murein DD-endopeptidase MepM/ murein hydrolase activator NlpD